MSDSKKLKLSGDSRWLQKVALKKIDCQLFLTESQAEASVDQFGILL